MENQHQDKTEGKKKIAVLGTGVSALSTLFELTDFPGWKDLYEITVYQPGWRAGGKTASSRGKNNRVEERGIHILQGWYWNMFRMIRRSYNERRDKKISPTEKFQNWVDAVVKDDTTLLTTEKADGSWDSWPFIFPEDNLIPGDPQPITFKVGLVRFLGVAFQLLFGSPYKTRKGIFSFIPKFLFKLVMKDYPIDQANPEPLAEPHYTEDPIKNARRCQVDMGQRLEDRLTVSLSLSKYILFCTIVWPVFWIYTIFRILLYPLLMVWTRLQRLFVTFEWILISTKGALSDCYNFKKREIVFASVNEDDYRVWLKKKRGSSMMIRCGLVKFMYYGSFANQKDGGPGTLASDIALRIVLDTVFYRGSLVWKTRAGTGGTLIAPLVQVLENRGVNFRFFHRVEEIVYSDNKQIEEIKMVQQVKLLNDTEIYKPNIMVNNVTDWPLTPLMDQLDPEWAAKLEQSNVNLESSWADWTDYKQKPLKLGEDFDQIVLGIPVAALKDICKGIIDKEDKWKKMVDGVPTIQTFGAQMWIKPTVAEMGFNGPDWGLRTTDEPNSVNYANLLYSWTDMSQILLEEDWPEDNQPGDLAYFTGTMSDSQDPLPPYTDHGFPETQYKRVFDFTNEWMSKYLGWIFPSATPKDNPNGLDLSLLMNPNNTGKKLGGEELYQMQYFVANIDPSNRYTLAHPGTDKFRLKANESGFRNLFLTGDWTDFGLNVGHMEGACVAGIRTAEAVLDTYTRVRDMSPK